MISVQITGTDRLIARLGRVSNGLRESLRNAVQVTVLDLQAQVQRKLSGPVLKARTGRLRNSIATSVESDAAATTGTVAAKTPYAAVHEYGFQGVVTVREHLREMTSAFGRPVSPAREVLVKSHPRKMDMPERSYLRSTLSENALRIEERLRLAVQQALYDEALAE